VSVIDQAKEIAGLIKKIGDIELYRKIVELEGEIIELTRSKHELEDTKSNLEKQLALKKSMVFKAPFFFQENDPVPFCSRCWEKENQLVHMNGFPAREPTSFECTGCFVKYEAHNMTSGEKNWILARYPKN
jgi:hypothetical protein